MVPAPPGWPPNSPLDSQGLITLCNTVRASGTHNFRGTRLPIPTHLNISVWRHLLVDYADYQVCDFLEFGWPINYTADHLPRVPVQNHRSAHRYATAVDNDIAKDLKMTALIGPFHTNPLQSPLTISPIMSVPKPDAADGRRIVIDMSFPNGSSVNDGIPRDEFLGSSVELHFPSVDTLAAIVRRKGRGALMFKKDLKAAYKQLPVCPFDWPLCAVSWRNSIFIYIREIFGLRTSALACQRTTSCVTYLYGKAGYECCNYLDDIGGADSPARARLAYVTLGKLLEQLNLWEKVEKAAEPSTRMVFLGILLDSTEFTLTIPSEKLAAARQLLEVWNTKRTASKTELQSLLGSLQHLCCCVRGGRVFLNRMLNTLRNMSSGDIIIDTEFRKDLFWWRSFLEEFNGVSIMQELSWSQPDGVFASDACLQGAGGFFQGQFFHVDFPPELRHLHINALEMLAIIVCCKLWGASWGGRRIQVNCDNMCCVILINSSRSREAFLQACIRELWFICSKFSFELRASHISGVDNRIPDHLSRWSSAWHRSEFFNNTRDYHLSEKTVSTDMFNFTHPW